MRKTTLCYVVKDGRVLLAMKKRGFGLGKWNGPGGKVQDGETPEQGCRREFMEEAGCGLVGLKERGIVEFVFEDKPEWHQLCHIYVAADVEGEPHETEEMLPQWHGLDGLPWANMWESDAVWLSAVLGGGTVNMRIFFDADCKMLRHKMFDCIIGFAFCCLKFVVFIS